MTSPPCHITIRLFVRSSFEVLHRYTSPAGVSFLSPRVHGRQRRCSLCRLRCPFSIGHQRFVIGADEGTLSELGSLRFVVAFCGAVDTGEAELGIGVVDPVGTDHASFEGIHEQFEIGEAGAYEGAGDNDLPKKRWDPEVVDQVQGFWACGPKVVAVEVDELKDLSYDGTGKRNGEDQSAGDSRDDEKSGVGSQVREG